uniref:Uncharacterized protein n=1 Tax=Biomphalaria glabrata TaxID=6526 RepID=A0A2C9LCL4_BIOGL
MRYSQLVTRSTRSQICLNVSGEPVLDLTNNFYLGLEAIGNLMYGLRNSQTLRRLKIQRVVPRFSPCILILSKTLRYFRNISLEIIEAMDNEIEMIEFGALKMLPATLKTVNLTNNKIMFGAYWKNMGELFSLENLHLDGFFKPVQFPLLFPDSSFKCVSPPEGYGSFPNNGCICNDNSCSENQTDFMLPLPPKLRNVTMHSNSMAYIINNITFCSNNSLEYVDVSSNHFQTLQGPVMGLEHLKVLNMSSCFIETIGDTFFDNLTSLEHLNLYQNLLGDCLNADLKGQIFDKLTYLESINISFNNLYRLNRNAFGSMENLLALDLSINRLSHANFSGKEKKYAVILGISRCARPRLIRAPWDMSHRWTLRYWYHAAKIKMSSTREVDVKDFKYDVFVSYANSDIDFILQ